MEGSQGEQGQHLHSLLFPAVCLAAQGCAHRRDEDTLGSWQVPRIRSSSLQQPAVEAGGGCRVRLHKGRDERALPRARTLIPASRSASGSSLLYTAAQLRHSSQQSLPRLQELTSCSMQTTHSDFLSSSSSWGAEGRISSRGVLGSGAAGPLVSVLVSSSAVSRRKHECQH